METTMDTLMITIESASKDASKQVDNLITKLGQLQTALKNVSGQSKNLSNLSSSLKSVTSSSGVKSLGKDYGTLSEQLEKLGLNMKDLGDPIKTIEGADSVTKKYKTSTGQLVNIFEKTSNSGNKIKVTLTEVADSTKKGSSAFDLLQSKISGTILKTKLFVSGLTGLIKGVVYFTQKAADYEESLNLFTVTMGDQAKQGVEWLEKFSNALYLDPTQVMQYMGSFNSLIKGLGTASDKAYLMSKNLTQLTYDLASFKNIKPEVAFQKLQSAISGEIEPLRNVGVALSENTLQELAYSLGLKTNVRDLTEAQKAQLRYIQIMKSSKEWQTDMGRTLVTPASALRILRQEFTMLSRAIGRIFIPIIMSVMPYVIALSQLLTDLANKLAKFLGYKPAKTDYSGLTNDVKDLSNGVSDIGASADKTKKQLNTMLAPFDELNVVQENVKKSGSGLGGLGGGGDLGLDLSEYDALAKLTDEMDQRVENAKKNLNKIKNIAIAIGSAIGLWKLANFIDGIQKATKLSKGLKKAILGISLIAGGIALGKIGDQDIKNKDTFLRGVGEQLGGSLAIAGGVWLLTGNLQLGLLIGAITLSFHGVKTAMHGDNPLVGIGEMLAGVFGSSAVAFAIGKKAGLGLTGNVTMTLAVTAVLVWGNVIKEIQELAKMKPTLDELEYGISHMFDDVPILGDTIDWLGEKGADVFGGLKDTFEELKNGLSVGKDNMESSLKELGASWDNFWVNVGNTFDAKKQEWSQKWNDLKDNTKNTWNELWVNVGNILDNSKSKITQKWNDLKVAAGDTFSNIKTTITTKWSDAKNWLSNNIGSKKTWSDRFGTILSGASSVLDNLKTKFSNWKAKLKAPHMTWDSDGWKATGTLKKVLSTLNLPTTLPKLKVDWYKDGGFPSAADLFFANENGVPEMVGRIGNQTAVANQDQITTSITNALLQALNQYDFGNNQPNRIVVNIGGKKIYDGYGDYINSETDRYGTTTLNI